MPPNEKDMENELELKWERLRQAMAEAGVDGCLVATNRNLYWLMGRVVGGYFYLPVEGEPHCFLKRPAEVGRVACSAIRKPEQLPEAMAGAGLPLPRRLMLEDETLTHAEYVRLQRVFASSEVVGGSQMLRRLRAVKTPWEIDQMRQSARRQVEVYRQIPSCYRPGMTDLELQIEIERLMRLHGSYGAFHADGTNMEIFMGSLLAGSNAEVPSPFDFALGGAGMHACSPLGANGTRLEEGMAVMVDMSGNYTAYQSDMTRVFAVGRLPEEAVRAHRVSCEITAHMEATARAGVSCAQLYRDAYDRAVSAGLERNFMGTRLQAKFVGHGIGLDVNELPVLTPRSQEVLQPGMTFAFEPKFVIPQVGAVGIENTYLVTENGVEKLTLLDEQIVPLA